MAFMVNPGGMKEWLLEHGPFSMSVHETAARLQPAPHNENDIMLVVECPVREPEAITTEPSIYMWRGGRSEEEDRTPAPEVRCPEIDMLVLRAEEVCGALSLLFDAGVVLNGTTWVGGPDMRNALVADDGADEEILQRLDHPEVAHPLRLVEMANTIGSFPFSGKLVGRLAERPGIRALWEARLAASPVSRFRDLWRTLELAFGAQGKTLREKLLALPATTELGFDAEELTDYEILRGRASHAASRLGHREAATVFYLTGQRIPRLEALVERVLLTKGENADGEVVVDELLPFRADLDPAGFNRWPWEDPVRPNKTDRA
jgi:hypothetical protein